MTDKILYYPYIEIPNNAWTINSLLYWDEIGTIFPEVVDDYYDDLEDLTKDLLSSGFLKRINPKDYNFDKKVFYENLLKLIQSEEYEIENKRKLFEKGEYGFCYTEKFDEKFFYTLQKLGLANRDNEDKFNVESHTANLLILMLATELSEFCNYTPSTDDEHYLTYDYFKTVDTFKNCSLRNEILNEVLPHPEEIKLSQLEKFKGKYQKDLVSFRREIELVIDTLSKIESEEERTSLKERHLNQLRERIEFIVAKMTESKFKKIWKSSWVAASVSTIASLVLMNPIPLITGASSAAIGSTKNLLTDSTKGYSMRYVGLLSKEFK